MKKAIFCFLVGLMISLSGCDKHILKKLKKDQPNISTSSKATTTTDQLTLPVYPKGDLTGFPNKKNKVYLVASIKRTPCLGSCSIYEAKLYSDGKATFFGRKNVHMKGRFEGKVTQLQMKELIEQINEADFFNFESSYPTNDTTKRVSENSKTILTVQVGDSIKKVKTNNEGPVALLDFENYLDELFDRLDWVAK